MSFNILQIIQDIFTAFANKVVQVLPLSPFLDIEEQFNLNSEWVGWLNWFVPFGGLVRLLAAWLVAYGLYLLYRIILRWIKAVS